MRKTLKDVVKSIEVWQSEIIPGRAVSQTISIEDLENKLHTLKSDLNFIIKEQGRRSFYVSLFVGTIFFALGSAASVFIQAFLK